jgi:polyhydroxyalkanoate synthase
MVDAEFLQGGFSLIKPMASTQKWRGFLENCWNEKYLKSFLPMEEWVTDNVDVPGPTYKLLIEELYRSNKLIEGTFELGGERVRLEEIDCPVMAAISGKDHIVPDPAARCLVDFVTSSEREVFECGGGHIGAVVGRAARTQLWPAVESWLRDHPVTEQERTDG